MCPDNWKKDETGECVSNCKKYEFGCADGKCLPLWKVNDGTRDCMDDENPDVIKKYNRCGLGYVMCPDLTPAQLEEVDRNRNGSYCITLHDLCDGKHHCPGGTDEQFCEDFDCSEIGRKMLFLMKKKSFAFYRFEKYHEISNLFYERRA